MRNRSTRGGFPFWEGLPKNVRLASWRALFREFRIGRRGLFEGTPLPRPTKSRYGRGFRRNGVQNLERLEVRSQNPDFKELAAFFETRSWTAFALAMICCFDFVCSDCGHIGCGNLSILSPLRGWLIKDGGPTACAPSTSSGQAVAAFFRRFAAELGAGTCCYNSCREKANSPSGASCGGDSSGISVGCCSRQIQFGLQCV